MNGAFHNNVRFQICCNICLPSGHSCLTIKVALSSIAPLLGRPCVPMTTASRETASRETLEHKTGVMTHTREIRNFVNTENGTCGT